MSDPDRDTAPEARTDPRYDDFPLDRHDAYTEWDVQRETPADDDAIDEVAEEYADETDTTNVRWIGLGGQTKPYLYDPGGEVIYEGELDEQEERVILREASRREVDEERSLGQHIEEFGERHDWEWLSSFAREHLEGDGESVRDDRVAPTEPANSPEDLRLRDSEFQRRNLLEDEEADVGFFGSHTLVDDDGWVHVLERQFDVRADAVESESGDEPNRVDDGRDSVDDGRGSVDDGRDSIDGAEPRQVEVTVREEYLVSEAESAERRAGDADLIAERERDLTVEARPGEFGWENEVADELQEWHESHVEWPQEA